MPFFWRLWRTSSIFHNDHITSAPTIAIYLIDQEFNSWTSCWSHRYFNINHYWEIPKRSGTQLLKFENSILYFSVCCRHYKLNLQGLLLADLWSLLWSCHYSSTNYCWGIRFFPCEIMGTQLLNTELYEDLITSVSVVMTLQTEFARPTQIKSKLHHGIFSEHKWSLSCLSILSKKNIIILCC